MQMHNVFGVLAIAGVIGGCAQPRGEQGQPNALDRSSSADTGEDQIRSRDAAPPESPPAETRTLASNEPVVGPAVEAAPDARASDQDPAIPEVGIDAANLLPVELPGLRFWPGRGWVRQEPTSQMRAAQFRLPLEDWDQTERDSDAQLVVYYFGEQGAGPIQANIDRWLSQFEPAGDRPLDAKTEQTTLNGLDATIVRVRGTYVAENLPGSGVRRNEKNWAMVALIVQTDAGPYYVRFLGPRPTIRQHELGIAHMIDSIEAN